MPTALKAQVTVRIDRRPLTALIRAMPGRSKAVVLRNAQAIAERARANAHVITGSMRDSVYVNSGADFSDYVHHAALAIADNPRAHIMPEIPPSSERAGAIVGVAVEHGWYEERRAGHMFLTPAAMTVQPAFFEDAGKTIVAL